MSLAVVHEVGAAGRLLERRVGVQVLPAWVCFYDCAPAGGGVYALANAQVADRQIRIRLADRGEHPVRGGVAGN